MIPAAARGEKDRLAPVEDYTFLGTTDSAEKWVVEREGRVSLRKARWIPCVEKRNGEFRLLFDPADHVLWVREAIAHSQFSWGLHQGYLPIVEYEYTHPGRGQKCRMTLLAVDARESGKLDGYVALAVDGEAPRHLRLGTCRSVSESEFASHMHGIVSMWEKFFRSGPDMRTEDPLLVTAAKASIIRALTTFTGLHPHYGVNYYGHAKHDGFPPTIIAVTDCLCSWGHAQRAAEYLAYYFDRFISDEGAIDYYGPSLAEHGQLLELAARMGAVIPQWFEEHRGKIEVIRARLMNGLEQDPSGLLTGVPEADEHKNPDYYLHNNAWCWRGMSAVARTLHDEQALSFLERYRRTIEEAVSATTVTEGGDTFLSPVARPIEPFHDMNQDRFASYTNYRYWLELLSSGLLSSEQMRAIIDYRRRHGGEIYGLTRFSIPDFPEVGDAVGINNWPLYEYGKALWDLGDRGAFTDLLCAQLLEGQTVQTWTPYEWVFLEGTSYRSAIADTCVPCQLVVPRLVALMQNGRAHGPGRLP